MNWHCTLIQISSLGDWWWHATDALSQWTGSVLSISLESIFSSRVTQDEEFMKTDASLYKGSHGETELSWFVYVFSHSTKTPNVPWLHEHHIVSKWSAELLGSSLGQLRMRSLSSHLCRVPSWRQHFQLSFVQPWNFEYTNIALSATQRTTGSVWEVLTSSFNKLDCMVLHCALMLDIAALRWCSVLNALNNQHLDWESMLRLSACDLPNEWLPWLCMEYNE